MLIYLLESPHRGDSIKYPKHMFLEMSNTMFLHNSDLLSPLARRFRASQIIGITNIVVPPVGIKFINCICPIRVTEQTIWEAFISCL